MRISRPFSAAACAFVLVAGPGRAALADDVLPSIDARTWRPSVDPHANLVLEPVSTPGPWAWSVGGFFDYAFRPVTLTSTSSSDVSYRPVDSVVTMNIVADLGLGKRASVGVGVPAVIYQTGTEALPGGVETLALPATALGDLSLHGKAAIIDNQSGGFGLAADVMATVPTGAVSSFAGEGAATGQLRLTADYSVVIAHLQASLGYFVRTERRTWPEATLLPSDQRYEYGDAIPWSLGISLRPDIFHLDRDDRQVWEVAAHGWVPAGPTAPFVDPGAAALSPVLLSLSDRIALGHDKDTYVLGGMEIGLSDAVGVPGFRAVAGIGWAPREHDKDHDGVPDDEDQCEDIPEDRDGFEDSDGCPEVDNDDDGIVDREDACPNVKGAPSSDPKKNGCPAADRDGDGVPDDVDACPAVKGAPSADPKRDGCPTADKDKDGVPDDVDKCPDQPEDKDGYQDSDGCPDPDNDGDGVPDTQDACPLKAGEPSTNPKYDGCPNPDRDGDTFLNDVDKCPDAAETFNGVDDDDGCPDEGGKPLVVVAGKPEHPTLRLAKPIEIAGAAGTPSVDPASMPTLRALALELSRHRDWTLAVGARPKGASAQAQSDALFRAIAVVNALSSMTRRDDAAETVGWDAVRGQPGAASGIGLLVLVAPPVPPPAKPGPPPPPEKVAPKPAPKKK